MRSAAAGLMASGILTATAAANLDALERHRPILKYDREERDRTTAVDAIARRLGDQERVDLGDERAGPEVVYGHAVADGGRTWLQYWLFFLTNDQDRGIVRTGRHEGDWELAQIRLGPDGRPDLVTLAQHKWAEGCSWRELDLEGDAPVLYVANGSHALYSKRGRYDRPFPDPTDEARGDGRRARPPVRPLGAWVRWPGRWGDSDGRLPFEEPSPRGPAFQDGDRFTRPAKLHADEARPCGSGPPSRAWQWPLAAGALLAIGAAGRWLRRRATYNRPP